MTPARFSPFLLNRPSRTRRRLRGEINSTAWTIIAALGIAATVVMVSQGMSMRAQSKADNLFNEISSVVELMRQKFGADFTQFGVAATSSAMLANLNMVHAPDQVSGGIAVTPWGGALQAAGLTVTTFYIDLRNTASAPAVPPEACALVVQKLSGMGGVADFQVNGGAALGTSSPTLAQATTLCAGSAYVIMN